MAPKIKIPVRRTGRALAHLHSKPSPHMRLVPHFAGTLRSPQIEMRSAQGWRQPELHFGEARTRFPASHEPPGGASQEPCAHLRSKCASRMGGGSRSFILARLVPRFPASHEPPGGASREPCAHLRSKCASRMGGGSRSFILARLVPRFPASHEPPGGASREPCAHLRSKCASRMGGGSEFEKPVSIAKNNTTTMSWCYFLERATRLELATSTLARWRSTR